MLARDVAGAAALMFYRRFTASIARKAPRDVWRRAALALWFAEARLDAWIDQRRAR